MSKYDYDEGKRIAASDPPFAALIMAAMRRADSQHLTDLQMLYPEIWNELQARYDAPGGVLAGERIAFGEAR